MIIINDSENKIETFSPAVILVDEIFIDVPNCNDMTLLVSCRASCAPPLADGAQVRARIHLI